MSSARTCVLTSALYPVAKAYAEALALTRGLAFFPIDKAAYLSLSRYDLFILADDPNSMAGAYLIHQCPGRVAGLSVSCEGKLLARQLSAVKEGKLSHMLVPSKDDCEGLQLSTPNVRWAPIDPPSIYPIGVYGLSLEDSKWLRIVTGLTKAKVPFALLSPLDTDLLSTLERFPATFAVIKEDQVDRAVLQSRTIIYSDDKTSDHTVVKARAFGKNVVSTSSVAENADPAEFIRSLAEFSAGEHNDCLETIHKELAKQGDYGAPNFLQIGGIPLQSRFNKLLVKFATRGRPKQFYKVFREYVELLSGRNHVTFLVSIDVDDEDMPLAEVTKKLEKYIQDGGYVEGSPGQESVYRDWSVKIQIECSTSTGKINAINRDMDKAPEFDVLLLASDDMIPQEPGYDSVILQAMEKHFPSNDGVLWFNDGYVGKRLNTLVCMGKKYYNRFGHIYHPDYTALWCDNDFMRVANMLGRQVYIDWTIIKHEHPANTAAVQSDPLYDLNDKWYPRDQAVFEKRKGVNFGQQQRVLLSILIPTLVNRRTMRQSLVHKLYEQFKALSIEGLVEVIVDEDKGEKSIGTKRTDLVKRAKGEYIMFLDDDDDVADNYIESIVAALADGDVDCVSFGGITIDQNGTGKAFVHSLRYSEYSEDDNLYYRPPNHLNAVRKEIAVRHPFPDQNFSEDTEYSMAMVRAGALRSERFIPYPLYLYRPIAGGAANSPDPHASNPRPPGTVAKWTTGPVQEIDNSIGKRKSAARTRRTTRRR